MDYGRLIRDAWSTTWHHRFLWILGLFTGTAVSTCSGAGNRFPAQVSSSQAQPSGFGAIPLELEQLAGSAGQWFIANLALILVALLLLFVITFVVSTLARAGMTEATVDLARHQPTSLGRAWHFGRILFWRFLGLALVPLGLALGVAFVFAVGTALALGTSALVAEGARGPVIGIWILLAVLAILATVILAIALSIILAYAQRIVVIENVGVVQAIGEGWQVLRTHLGSSLLTWVINVALTVGAEIVVGVVMAVVAALLVGIGFAVWSVAGFTAATWLYVTISVAAVIALVWGMEAIVNTFFWNYWTLAYLQLTSPRPQEAG